MLDSKKKLSREEMKNVTGGNPWWGVCAPNGSRPTSIVAWCCSGHSCEEFGVGPICYDPDQGKPCRDLMI